MEFDKHRLSLFALSSLSNDTLYHRQTRRLLNIFYQEEQVTYCSVDETVFARDHGSKGQTRADPSDRMKVEKGQAKHLLLTAVALVS